MTTRFSALSNDGINPTRFEPLCFRYGGGGGNNFAAPSTHLLKQSLLRQTKVKADYLWGKLHQYLCGVLIKRTAFGGRRNVIGVDVQFGVVRRQMSAPIRFPLGICRRNGMAEKIHIKWFVCQGAKSAELLA